MLCNHSLAYAAAMANGSLQKLFDIIATLRGKDGCPWDREQTAENIISDLAEEVYEMQWAYTTEGETEVLDETGDVVFVMAFALTLIQERFPNITLDALTQHAYDKIYSRHPHVFGDAVARTKEEGLAHWESMKAEERRRKRGSADPFADVPGNLPPLRRAEKLQKRATRSGFDWDNPRDIVSKIREELDELEPYLQGGDSSARDEELGDLLFTVSNLCRFLSVDAERVLADANAKFRRRYNRMTELAASANLVFDDLDITEKEKLWQQAKRAE